MKQNLLSLVAIGLLLPMTLAGQETTSTDANSGSQNVSPFTQSSKRFNDWSISAGAGVPLIQSADMASIKNGNGKNLFGYSAYISVDKAITHAFGLNLQYDRGETRQGYANTKDHVNLTGNQIAGRTQYNAISILGDLNFSNLLRRVDNKSPFRWALHGYAGIGTMSYKSYRQDPGPANQTLNYEVKPFKLGSLFGQAGAGLKFKINNRLDLEGRVMYVVTGDDEFDGAGVGQTGYNLTEDQISDNFFNTTLGLTFKLGKHESHLMWHDPLQEIYYKLDVLNDKTQDLEVCKKGDVDNDGVCDDWDRQLDTPAGARVDGAGVALDVDLDGVIDLYDKCVTVPGPVENNGCPLTMNNSNTGVVTDESTIMKGIEFDLDSDKVLPSNTPILNNAINFINSSDSKFNVIGGTDTRASDVYNKNLSERRANNVKDYLIQNGADKNKLQAMGRGEKDLLYPECDPAEKCPEWKNRANRRVYFEAK
ncbi:OmpA family protein [Epilithonimonas lactis]|uniref:Membrane protein n=1 Tax=Epilithonimonas lactis TaxID=421072 RepID=A0A085BL10_9FLAO|nr:OmpA family protein [Epilithonimonas lactis]KFC18511.1 membrane protein [Epilithonimonas lactis]KFC23155.1 membrane protein [Epilithonimonas lactis]SEQ70657.1 OmpA-OmpF porin, OOP family [Epilithonimonas lactis]